MLKEDNQMISDVNYIVLNNCLIILTTKSTRMLGNSFELQECFSECHEQNLKFFRKKKKE